MLKNKDILFEILHDAEDFARMKGIKLPPIYFLGGSGCIMGDYINRATTDFDFIDMDYSSTAGKVFRLFDRFDMLDRFVTPIADGFELRALKLEDFEYINCNVLSKEDIVVSKLSRYSEKDVEDIGKLIIGCDLELLNRLIENVIDRQDFSERVKKQFIINVKKLKEQFDV